MTATTPSDELRSRGSGPSPGGSAPDETPSLVARLWQRKAVQRTITWGGIAIAWEVVGHWQGPFFFPTFTGTIASYPDLIDSGVGATLVSSLKDMLIGFMLAALVGVAIGWLIGISKWANWALKMYVDALFVTSLSALLPFLIIVFGTGVSYRVIVVFLFAVVYVIMTTAAGVRSLDHNLLEVAVTFGASRWKVLWSVILPATLPYILTGWRLGMAQAVQGLIVAQLWVLSGIGKDLHRLGEQRDLPKFFALALVIAIVGAGLVQLLHFLQKRITPWAPDTGKALTGADT
jgi:NitT/TauT family transport system permease protein